MRGSWIWLQNTNLQATRERFGTRTLAAIAAVWHCRHVTRAFGAQSIDRAIEFRFEDVAI